MNETVKNRIDLAKNLLLIIGLTLLSRLLFIFLMPSDCFSQDVNTWMGIVHDLKEGKNPYVSTAAVVWLPLWMQILYWIDRMAVVYQTRFDVALRVFLTIADCVIASGLFVFLLKRFGKPLARKLVYIGFVFNPVTYLLTVQHGNFDGLIGLLILLTAVFLVSYSESSDPQDWFLACFFTGMGILLKTTPMVLVPLLAAAWLGQKRPLSIKTLILGLFLLAGPPLIGLSVIYVLSPQDIQLKVFGYRSTIAYGFGYPWLLYLVDRRDWIGYVIQSFGTWMRFLGVLGALAYLATPRDKRAPVILAYCVLLFVSIKTFGPGHGNQYAFWFIPVALCLYAYSKPSIRKILTVLYGLLAFNYICEYAFKSYLGAFYRFPVPESSFLYPLAVLTWASNQGLARLPFWLMYHVLVFFIVRGMIQTVYPKALEFIHQVRSGGIKNYGVH